MNKEKKEHKERSCKKKVKERHSLHIFRDFQGISEYFRGFFTFEHIQGNFHWPLQGHFHWPLQW